MSYRIKTIDGVERRHRMASWFRALAGAVAIIAVAFVAMAILDAAIAPVPG